MSNRFDSSGSFSPASFNTTLQQPTSLSNASAGYSKEHTPVSTERGGSTGRGGGKQDKKSSESSEYEYDGRRPGVSPTKIGLAIGIALIAYGIFQTIDFSGGSKSSKNEIREYRPQLRPMDVK